jgi:CHAD domain-containing protein
MAAVSGRLDLRSAQTRETKTEIEHKYDIPTDFALPDLTRVAGVATVGEPAELQLDATYYDTEELGLARNQITLRRRSGGHDAGWHLKRKAADEQISGARTEAQAPLTKDVPEEFAAQLRTVSRGAPLEAVARIRTRRLERPLRDPDGAVLALLADDVVASESPGEPAIVQQWRELEVELVDGTPAMLDRVDEALRAAGARPAGSPSKLVRALAYRLATLQPTRVGSRTKEQSLIRYARRQRDAIVDNEAGARAGDADAVHDMRVATRRLRSHLRTFRKLFDRSRTEPLRDELQWLGGVLGAVRDGDVMAERLGEAVAAEPAELVVGPVAEQIRHRLSMRTSKARKDLIAALDSPRYALLLDALDELATAAPSKPPRAGRLRRLAHRAIRRADRRLDAAVDTEGDDRNVRLHDARKAYKRARYAAEAVGGKPGRRLAKRFSVLQDVLGAHQDAIVTGELLRDYGMRAHTDGENAFTYGLLHARQHEAGENVLRGLAKARRQAGKRKVRRWLRR